MKARRNDFRTARHVSPGFLLWPFSRVLGASDRFVILCTPRSGSSLLVSLLNAHPDIECENEILKMRPSSLPAVRFLASRSVLARVRRRARVYGCKAVTDDVEALPHEPSTFVRDLHRRGYRIILLTRRDLLAQTLSFLYATREGTWLYRSGDRVDYRPFVVEPGELQAALENAQREVEWAEAAVAGLPHLRLTYEDDLESAAAQQQTVDRICASLGLPSVRATTSLERGGPPSNRDRIVNFDAAMDALRDSPFAAYAERPDAGDR